MPRGQVEPTPGANVQGIKITFTAAMCYIYRSNIWFMSLMGVGRGFRVLAGGCCVSSPRLVCKLKVVGMEACAMYHGC